MDSKIKRIILVDDEEIIIKSITRELSVWCDEHLVSIESFTSPVQALEYIQGHANDIFLVISDLRMPEMKGSELLSRIHKEFPDILLFLLTAYSDIEDIQTAVSASISRLILKPWESVLLEADVQNALEIHQIREENRSLQAEINHNIRIAGEFQQQLLSSAVPDSGNLDIEFLYKPVSKLECGGDFYDYFEIDTNRIVLMMGDVSGHGIKPAFVTAMLKVLCAMQRPLFFERDISTAEIMGNINDGLLKSLEEVNDILVSFSVIFLNKFTKRLQISGAGQLPLYLIRGEEIITLKNDGVVMGFQYGCRYTEISRELKTDDLVVLFTDGLIESERMREKLDDQEILAALSSLDLRKNPAQTIYDCFQELQRNQEFPDDVTLITIRI